MTAISGVRIGAADPAAMAARWAEVLDLPLSDVTTVATDDASIGFQPAGRRAEGLDEVDVVAADRARAGEALALCGVVFNLV